jgi:hypothetical protein
MSGRNIYTRSTNAATDASADPDITGRARHGRKAAGRGAHLFAKPRKRPGAFLERVS